MAAAPPKHIAVAGSVNADLVFSMQRVPRAGETLPARSLAVHPGGKVRWRWVPPPVRPPARCSAAHCVSPQLPTSRPLFLQLQGGNQAAAAARLGCATKLVAQVGRDAQAAM